MTEKPNQQSIFDIPEIGKITETNGKLYSVCQYCHRLVRLNKPVFGSFHVCASTQEQRDMIDAGTLIPIGTREFRHKIIEDVFQQQRKNYEKNPDAAVSGMCEVGVSPPPEESE